ncbi:cytochrome P450 [Mycena albidolilacea]|uniref:Cytochrome P450 n=1 Tax=Mycena albidolilacea TaxID=1033008 RepID=A0AAD6ZJA1_9AGAR|nr:cytochrome P450 [Mycena albidolilacea]
MAVSLSQYGLVALVACAVWSIFRRFAAFGTLRNIPGPPSYSILTGNLSALFDPDGWEFHKTLEEHYGQVVKLLGLLGTPHLFVFDPTALHSILVQDADAYEETRVYQSLYGLLWGPGLFACGGEDHYRYRKISMPAFSTTKIREMIPIFYEVVEKARDNLISPHLTNGPKTLDLSSILNRTSLEIIGIIGRAGIGYSFDPMIPGEAPHDKYANTIKELLRSIVDIIPWKTLHRAKDIVDEMHSTTLDLILSKKAAVARGQLDMAHDANDIMSLLLKGNLTADEGLSLTDEELVGQTGMIISAAADTTSSALARMFHVLALFPDVQKKLRAEIVESSEHMDFDQLGSLPYLDGYVHEVLRLTLKDTVLPLSEPLTGINGKAMTSIPVPKGTTVYIVVGAANHNRRIWGGDALEFKPERWQNGKAGDQMEKISGIYGNTMTFIGGEQIVLSVFLRHFKFSLVDQSVSWKIPGIIAVPIVEGKIHLPLSVENLEYY